MGTKRKERGRGRGGVVKEDDPLELRLYRDPWVIKKKLKESDLNGLSKVILPGDQVEKHVMPFLNPQEKEEVISTQTKGLQVTVKDLDSNGSRHMLSFKKWSSSGSYKLGQNWIPEFVMRRGLQQGDTIGLFWDSYSKYFKFSVIERHDAEPVREAFVPPPAPSLCEFAHTHLGLGLSPMT